MHNVNGLQVTHTACGYGRKHQSWHLAYVAVLMNGERECFFGTPTGCNDFVNNLMYPLHLILQAPYPAVDST